MTQSLMREQQGQGRADTLCSRQTRKNTSTMFYWAEINMDVSTFVKGACIYEKGHPTENDTAEG